MAFARRTPHGLVALAAAAMVSLAACGGGGGTAGAAGSTAALEEELIEYTECLRDQGIDIDDPVVEPDGSVRMGAARVIREGQGGPGSGGGFRPMERAREVCGQPPAGAMSGSDIDPTEMQDAVLAFAQCMRDNGVDFPDPDFSSTGGGVIFQGGQINPDDPGFQAAQEECREHLPGDGPGARMGAARGGN